jgi:hypothetical protein
MSRTVRPMLLAAMLATLVGLAGCTSTVAGDAGADPDPAPTDGPGSDPVAWNDRVCGAVLTFLVPATSPPDFAATGDLPAVQRTFSDYLGGVIGGVQQGRVQLDAVGRAPQTAGDEAVGRAISALQVIEQDYVAAKNAVDTADVNNPQAFMATLTQVETTLAAITPPDPINDLRASPRLHRAAERAEQCQRLSSLAAALPG